MKSLKKLALSLVAAAMLSSCGFGTVPVGATSNTVGSKTGYSSSNRLLGFIELSDGGVAAAARQGGITKISTIDVKSSSFVIFSSVKTTVTGE